MWPHWPPLDREARGFPLQWFPVKSTLEGARPDSHNKASVPLEDNGDDIQPTQSLWLQKCFNFVLNSRPK